MSKENERTETVVATETTIHHDLADDDEEILPGMTMGQINSKHARLRGSLDLKYPPRDQVCGKVCGFKDLHETAMPARDHFCVYTRGHNGDCKFSSECAASDDD